MALYRTISQDIEAYQWDINKYDKDIEQYSNVVNDNCDYCNGLINKHGFMLNSVYNNLVCPGDYIITKKDNKRLPMERRLFKSQYYQVKEDYTI